MAATAWEKQANETSKAFEAFVTYREIGASRSHIKVARRLGKSVQLISRWSRRHNWTQRVSEYDQDLDRQRIANLAAGRAAMAQRHAAQTLYIQKIAMKALRQTDSSQLNPVVAGRLFAMAVRLERELRGDPHENEVTKLVVNFLPEGH